MLEQRNIGVYRSYWNISWLIRGRSFRRASSRNGIFIIPLFMSILFNIMLYESPNPITQLQSYAIRLQMNK